MPKKLPQRDPIGTYQRKVTAARRIGVTANCACGEERPEALIAGSNPTICAACDKERRGLPTVDKHHVFGKANSHVTLPVPVNDHRAILSAAQYDWMKATVENRDESPFLAAAGHIRGFANTVTYLTGKLLWIADFLEKTDSLLAQRFGRKWWRKTPLRRFEPRRISNDSE